MRYCVLIKIAKNKISFWYQIEGGAHAALSKRDGNEIPLYFYVNENNFLFGVYARERYLNGDPNAFGKYFEIVKDPSRYFTMYGNPRPVKQLLYIGIEQYLSHFLNSVPFKPDSIESHRPGFPLRFIFEGDLEENEKLLVETMFKEAGYNNIRRVSWFSAFFETLTVYGLVNKTTPVILLSAIDNNLFIELFKEHHEPLALKVIEGRGSDPRIKVVAEMILEDIIIRNPYLVFDKNSEMIHVTPFVRNNVKINEHIMNGTITLSDGTACYFNIKQRDLKERMLYHTGEEQINKMIELVLNENAVSMENVLLLLNGYEMNTGYFNDRLLKKFNKVKGVPSNIENEALKLIFKRIADEGKDSAPPPRPPVPSSIATSNEKNIKPPVPPALAEPVKKVTPPVPPIKNSTNKKNNVIGNEKLIGEVGIAFTNVSLSGKIEVKGALYNAVAQSEMIEKGRKVKIVSVHDAVFTVKELLLRPPVPPVKK